MPLFLTTASTIMCPHGGTVILSTSNTDAKVQNMPILLVTDIHQVAGCPLNISGSPHPCVTAEWMTGTVLAKHKGATPFLHQSSQGLCYAADRAPQGPPVIVQTQSLADGK